LTQARTGVRQFGAGQAEAANLMAKWKKYSLYVGIPVSTALFVVNMGLLATGDHIHNPADLGVEMPSYMKIRTKPYPWSCPDCNLFDGHCWDKCKGKVRGGVELSEGWSKGREERSDREEREEEEENL